jgi:hypothetical protein
VSHERRWKIDSPGFEGFGWHVLERSKGRGVREYSSQDELRADNAETLLGLEGMAAKVYFELFGCGQRPCSGIRG